MMAPANGALPSSLFPAIPPSCGSEPRRYRGSVHFHEKFAGWSLAKVVRHFGYLRPDGETLMAQPSLNRERMWKIDDIGRLGYEIKNPLRAAWAVLRTRRRIITSCARHGGTPWLRRYHHEGRRWRMAASGKRHGRDAAG